MAENSPDVYIAKTQVMERGFDFQQWRRPRHANVLSTPRQEVSAVWQKLLQ
jgi:hypothetical protein